MLAKKIVVSETAELLSALEASFFHREGFRLFPVRSNDMVFRLVEAEAPAMAILDLDVHGDDLLDCCRCIKRDPLLGGTPLIVLLPEEGEVSLRLGCRQTGCDSILLRPLDVTQLLEAACGLLGVSQRLVRRVPVDFEALYAAHDSKPKVGRVVNLNANGMFVAAEKLFPMGTLLRFDLDLPGLAGPLSCWGRVSWVNHPEWRKKILIPSGMGIQFFTPSPYFLDMVKLYLSRFTSDHS